MKISTLKEALSEFGDKLLKISADKDYLIKSNNKRDEDYRPYSTYNINDIYVAKITNADYINFNCNLGAYYMFTKTKDDYFLDDYTPFVYKKNITMYKEIFTGMKCYSEESERDLYENFDEHAFVEPEIKNKLVNIKTLKEVVYSKYDEFPEELKIEDLLVLFDAINCSKLEYNSANVKGKVFRLVRNNDNKKEK